MQLFTVFHCLLVVAFAAEMRFGRDMMGIDPKSFSEKLEQRLNNALQKNSQIDLNLDPYIRPNKPPRNPKPHIPNPETQPPTSTFSLSDLEALEKRLEEEIPRNTERNLVAEWVRLAFHDCSGDGGCDGCIDISDPKNRGSDAIFTQSRALYNEIKPKISFADFIALLGTVGARTGARAAGGSLNVPFSIGRKNCVQPSSERELCPSNSLTGIEFLSRKFGLSTEEAVALLGGHSLGGARRDQSGFFGPWDQTDRALDSAYYTALLEEPWNHTRIDNDRIKSTQWMSGNLMMLHADMRILKDFTVEGPYDEPSCEFRTCRNRRDTSGFVRTFAGDQNYWLQVFSKAFLKMLATGGFSLTRVY